MKKMNNTDSKEIASHSQKMKDFIASLDGIFAF